jgi:hypothetical protein
VTSASLKPFFTYFGGKYRAAPRYPPPSHDMIIEPFAGSAGYSTRYHARQVVLYDTNEKVAGTWEYLISVRPSEIMSIPLIGPEDSVDSLGVCQEAKWLVGWWLNKGAASPCRTPSAWMRQGSRATSFWGERVRARIAGQVDHIRHWRVRCASWSECPPAVATWFVDPPYQGAGRHYPHGSGGIDYADLGDWCAARRGQVVVCENQGASWLPFQPFATVKSTHGRGRAGVSKEVIYTHDV